MVLKRDTLRDETRWTSLDRIERIVSLPLDTLPIDTREIIIVEEFIGCPKMNLLKRRR